MAGPNVGARNPACGGAVIANEWSDWQTAKLLELWPDPANTLDVIAYATGKSRSAVGGKRRRLKLPERPSPISFSGPHPASQRARRKAAAAKKLLPRVTVPPLASEQRSAPPPSPIQLPSRWPHCQWILSDRKPHRFCQSPCDGTRPYCCEHARRAIANVTRTT